MVVKLFVPLICVIGVIGISGLVYRKFDAAHLKEAKALVRGRYEGRIQH
jgi:hypothetical protein